MIILLWQEKRLIKVTNIYGMATVWRLFWKGSYDIIYGSNEQRVIEKIRLLFFIVDVLIYAIINKLISQKFAGW